MSEPYYSVEQIAKTLGMHPKTIQRYIREGKLRAVKIGKSWRVTGHDLSRFAEESNRNPESHGPAPRAARDRARASAVIDLPADDPEAAQRIIRHLTAAMQGKPPEYEPASLTTQYIEAERTVRLTLWGNPAFLSAVAGLMDLYLQSLEEEP